MEQHKEDYSPEPQHFYVSIYHDCPHCKGTGEATLKSMSSQLSSGSGTVFCSVIRCNWCLGEGKTRAKFYKIIDNQKGMKNGEIRIAKS